MCVEGSRQSSARLRTVDDVGDGPYQMSTTQQHSGIVLMLLLLLFSIKYSYIVLSTI